MTQIFSLLQVRAAAVYALGTYISSCSSERSDHASNIDLGIGMSLTHIVNDGSPLVRQVSRLLAVWLT